MDGRGIRSAGGGADPAGEKTRREILRRAGAVLAVEGGGERGDEGEGDGGRTRSGLLGDADGPGDAGGAQGGERRVALLGGVREEGVRGGPGAVREMRRGNEARGGGSRRRRAESDSGARRLAGGVAEDEAVAVAADARDERGRGRPDRPARREVGRPAGLPGGRDRVSGAAGPAASLRRLEAALPRVIARSRPAAANFSAAKYFRREARP